MSTASCVSIRNGRPRNAYQNGSGRLDGLHAVSITTSYRLVLDFLICEQESVPVNIVKIMKQHTKHVSGEAE
ncbi:protein of unknown function [Trichlorobacter ammonificans]|uniref:Uncharacterized protein n=1 Tax=Trichlorobacter ammonificans TaxID=2916410 RepID=A0ABM9D8A7_9BACT|nr:protein of unknown function [Trichlorobacter ammonificans]